MAIRPNQNPPESAQIHSESQRLRELLEPIVLAHNLFLEDVQIQISGAHQAVHIVIDLPEDETGGVGLDLISGVSMDLSQALDDDPHDSGRPYDLEVSSPGVGRPLTEPRHWRRAKGRMVRVQLARGDDVSGRLLSVDDDGVTVRPEAVAKKGMKPKKGDPEHLSFERIREGRVEIEFSHPEDALQRSGDTARDSNSSAEEA